MQNANFKFNGFQSATISALVSIGAHLAVLSLSVLGFPRMALNFGLDSGPRLSLDLSPNLILS